MSDDFKESPYVDVDGAAKIQRVSTKTVRRQIDAGVITAYRVPGRRKLLLKRAELLEAIEQTAVVR